MSGDFPQANNQNPQGQDFDLNDRNHFYRPNLRGGNYTRRGNNRRAHEPRYNNNVGSNQPMNANTAPIRNFGRYRARNREIFVDRRNARAQTHFQARTHVPAVPIKNPRSKAVQVAFERSVSF
jgi:hypothetical protein